VIKEGEPRKYNDGEDRKPSLAMTTDQERHGKATTRYGTRASMIL